MKRTYVDLREPNAWKKTTRYQRWMASLNDKFDGNTSRIIDHLFPITLWGPEETDATHQYDETHEFY